MASLLRTDGKHPRAIREQQSTGLVEHIICESVGIAFGEVKRLIEPRTWQGQGCVSHYIAHTI
jgi:hypothetical protein